MTYGAKDIQTRIKSALDEINQVFEELPSFGRFRDKEQFHVTRMLYGPHDALQLKITVEAVRLVDQPKTP